MKTLTKGTIVLLISTMLLIASSGNVLADTWQGMYIHNNSGQTANDLEEWIEGDIRISNWYAQIFTSLNYTYLSGENVTKLRWFNGNVAHCQWVIREIKVDKNITKFKYLPRWSYDGVPGPVAGPALSHDFQTVATGLVNLTIANTPVDGGPITIGIIQVGPTDIVYPIEMLTWDNLNNINWCVTRNDLPLNLGAVETFSSLPMLPPAKGLVYRARVWLDADPTNIVEYTGQFVPTMGTIE